MSAMSGAGESAGAPLLDMSADLPLARYVHSDRLGVGLGRIDLLAFINGQRSWREVDCRCSTCCRPPVRFQPIQSDSVCEVVGARVAVVPSATTGSRYMSRYI